MVNPSCQGMLARGGGPRILATLHEWAIFTNW